MTRAGASVTTCTPESFKGLRHPYRVVSKERLAMRNETMKEFRKKYPL
jgi:hypothetical protein